MVLIFISVSRVGCLVMMGTNHGVKDDRLDEIDDDEEMVLMLVDNDDTSIISVSCFSISNISSTLFTEWHRSHLS